MLKRDFHVERIGVFGSYSRGDFSLSSDIDLGVMFSPDCDDLFDVKYKLRAYLESLFKKPIDLANLEALKPYIAMDIHKEIQYAI
jgi:predicted nucleotidyltransferase